MRCGVSLREWVGRAVLLAIAAPVLAFVPSTLAAAGPTSAPAAPKGFSSTEEVKDAIRAGKVKLVNLFVPVPESVKVTTDIEYGRVGQRPLKLDLYEPKDCNQPVPGVVLIHGGGWKGGDRNIYRFYCIRLAEKGYVAATVSYRFSKEAPFPAAVQDVKCAVRWMRASAAEHHIDPAKIGALGASAGGHLSMMLGYTPEVRALEGDGGHADVSSRVQAVIDFYGPTDLTTEFARSADVVKDFMGGKTYEESADLYRQASPMMHLTKKAPPTLILHGTIDDTVPIEQSDRLAKKLKELGVPCEYERLEGWPHTMDLAEDVNKRCWWRVEQFLARYLPLPKGAASRGPAAGLPGQPRPTGGE